MLAGLEHFEKAKMLFNSPKFPQLNLYTHFCFLQKSASAYIMKDRHLNLCNYWIFFGLVPSVCCTDKKSEEKK